MSYPARPILSRMDPHHLLTAYRVGPVERHSLSCAIPKPATIRPAPRRCREARTVSGSRRNADPVERYRSGTRSRSHAVTVHEGIVWQSVDTLRGYISKAVARVRDAVRLRRPN